MAHTDLTPLQQSLSGALAGILSRLIISPFDVIKIRFQLQSHPLKFSLRSTNANNLPKYNSLLNAFKTIVSEEGILGLWKGNLAATLLYFNYGGIQFYTFSALEQYSSDKKSFFNYIPMDLHVFTCGAIAGSMATFITFPFDLLRTRFAAQGSFRVYDGMFLAVRDIYFQEGFRGFFRGLKPSLISTIPQMGLIFDIHQRSLVTIRNLEKVLLSLLVKL